MAFIGTTPRIGAVVPFSGQDQSDYIASLAGPYIAIHDIAGRATVATLPTASKATATALCTWITPSGPPAIAVADAGGGLAIWTATGSQAQLAARGATEPAPSTPWWTCDSRLQLTAACGSAVTGTVLADGTQVVLLAGADACLRLLARGPEPSAAWTCTHTEQCARTEICETAEFCVAPGCEAAAGTVLLATGGTSKVVRLWVLALHADTGVPILHSVAVLTGLSAWARQLAWAHGPVLSTTQASERPSLDAMAAAVLAVADAEGMVRTYKIDNRALRDALFTVAAAAGAEAGRAVDTGMQLVADMQHAPTGADGVRVAAPHSRRHVEFVLSCSRAGWLQQAVASALAAAGHDGPVSDVEPCTSIPFDISVDSVTLAHEDSVTACAWAPPVLRELPTGHCLALQPPTLMTSALDGEVVLWQPEAADLASTAPDESALATFMRVYSADRAVSTLLAAWQEAGAWGPCARMGIAGGRLKGMFGACIAAHGTAVFAVPHTGGLLQWRVASGDAALASPCMAPACPALPCAGRVSHAQLSDMQVAQAAAAGMWKSVPTASGHVGPAHSVAWGTHDGYLLSCGHDKTTRAWVHVPVAASGRSAWMELARPQAHGHAMLAVTAPSAPGRPHTIVSAGDEKLLRAFTATSEFVGSLAAWGLPSAGADELPRAPSAYVPELALTNRPVRGSGPVLDRLDVEPGLGLIKEQELKLAARAEREAKVGTAGVGETSGREGQPSAVELQQREVLHLTDAGDDNAAGFGSHSLASEDVLMEGTLWPEEHKLYGHGNVIAAAAASHSGAWVASAAIARDARNAGIIIWRTGAWGLAATLAGHSSTVTDLAWAPDDEYLLSVSRDRHFALWRPFLSDAGEPNFARVALVKAHKRAVHAAAWTSCGHGFATGGRDGAVKVWAFLPVEGGAAGARRLVPAGAVELPAGCGEISALAWRPGAALTSESGAMLAIGTSSGALVGMRVRLDASSGKLASAAELLWQSDECTGHIGSVHKLAWNAAGGLLASAGADGVVRLHACE